MKGLQAIPAFIYVIIGIFVGLMMLMMVYKYSSIFQEKKGNITLVGNQEKVSKKIAEIIEECWENNRRGLGDESNICKEISLENGLNIGENDVVELLDCKKLPDSIYHCPSPPCPVCESDYYEDDDKISWLASSGDKNLIISYDGWSRKIVVKGYR